MSGRPPSRSGGFLLLFFLIRCPPEPDARSFLRHFSLFLSLFLSYINWSLLYSANTIESFLSLLFSRVFRSSLSLDQVKWKNTSRSRIWHTGAGKGHFLSNADIIPVSCSRRRWKDYLSRPFSRHSRQTNSDTYPVKWFLCFILFIASISSHYRADAPIRQIAFHLHRWPDISYLYFLQNRIRFLASSLVSLVVETILFSASLSTRWRFLPSCSSRCDTAEGI